MTEYDKAIIANKIMSLLFEFDCFTLNELAQKARWHIQMAQYIVNDLKSINDAHKGVT